MYVLARVEVARRAIYIYIYIYRERAFTYGAHYAKFRAVSARNSDWSGVVVVVRASEFASELYIGSRSENIVYKGMYFLRGLRGNVICMVDV